MRAETFARKVIQKRHEFKHDMTHTIGFTYPVVVEKITSGRPLTFTFTPPIVYENRLKCIRYECHFDKAEHITSSVKPEFGECQLVCHNAKFNTYDGALLSREPDALSIFSTLITYDSSYGVCAL